MDPHGHRTRPAHPRQHLTGGAAQRASRIFITAEEESRVHGVRLGTTRESANERLSTLGLAVKNPQVGSVGNSVGNQHWRTVLQIVSDNAYRLLSHIDGRPEPDHQIDAPLRNGVDRDNIHVDVASGAKASRPKLDLVMQLLREGDTLKVTRLDRLSRSVLHLVTLGAKLRERGIGLHVIEQGIDTATVFWRGGPCSGCCPYWQSSSWS